jgi:hypothetical protein
MKFFLAALLLISLAPRAFASGSSIGNGRCAEGQRERLDLQDDPNSSGPSLWICRNGQFLNTVPAPIIETRAEGCPEGDRQYWPDETGPYAGVNYFICRKGSYVPLYPRH